MLKPRDGGPGVFNYMDAHYGVPDGESDCHYVVVAKSNRKIFVKRGPINGELLDTAKGSIIRAPKVEGARCSHPLTAGEVVASESEAEEKPKARPKGKTRVQAGSAASSPEHEVESEESESENELLIVADARAVVRTQATTVKLRTSVHSGHSGSSFHDADSDIEEIQPPNDSNDVYSSSSSQTILLWMYWNRLHI
ncbi:hypothetical protein B0H14DRAFT_2587574 [Mycena olivaceomarginata]|nr:hypothetical protein B0H14DRAFT_2587574 [Mycena olivaceomarginata]